MGRFDVKNVDKTPSDAEEKEKYSVAGIQFDFAGKSKALNTLQVKSECRERNEGGRFSECLQVTSA